MAKSTNDALVQRHKQLRATLIQKHSQAGRRANRASVGIAKNKTTVEGIAVFIATRFLESAAKNAGAFANPLPSQESLSHAVCGSFLRGFLLSVQATDRTP